MFLRLEEVLKVLTGKWICFVDGQKISCDSGDILHRYKHYNVVSIQAQGDCTALEIEPWRSLTTRTCSEEEWYKEYVKQVGREPDFF